MTFRHLIVNGKGYGQVGGVNENVIQNKHGDRNVCNVNFADKNFFNQVHSNSSEG